MLDTDNVTEEDLALLDDDKAHARCIRCEPSKDVYEPFTALCGVKAVHHQKVTLWWVEPPRACEKCKAIIASKVCSRCGGAIT